MRGAGCEGESVPNRNERPSRVDIARPVQPNPFGEEKRIVVCRVRSLTTGAGVVSDSEASSPLYPPRL